MFRKIRVIANFFLIIIHPHFFSDSRKLFSRKKILKKKPWNPSLLFPSSEIVMDP